MRYSFFALLRTTFDADGSSIGERPVALRSEFSGGVKSPVGVIQKSATHTNEVSLPSA
jgi:hypothetical protein